MEVCAITSPPGPDGGRPSPDYWLNEGQALPLAMKSGTPVAGSVYSIPSTRSVAFASRGWSGETIVPTASRNSPMRSMYSSVQSAIRLPFGMRSFVSA
jgi:hypothetical protein